ncbi:hypothetical protein LH462_02275 [Laribacter hongkongensis]|uniref:Uncharacterized protein n=1 Tax=Laribacter hongkongensis TaxID=168471 RepID=A0ABD4SQU7_9NEIS|nr:hypothetical protein [Laribacter hongkongensis]MCG9025586.1 hypothetical protein [Laribacter hongkongensis]MCG9100147.1 hypothetical protein [Laribacter hongkongensis]MCG9102560.1 hypothetical protein [Laribacter hongkongensis]MCG9114215.1 hypothetical protein [Laribacter hongkongensis]MCG9119913.1 hypothetical protein [Laribacter hongkongensis]
MQQKSTAGSQAKSSKFQSTKNSHMQIQNKYQHNQAKHYKNTKYIKFYISTMQKNTQSSTYTTATPIKLITPSKKHTKKLHIITSGSDGYTQTKQLN